MEDLEAQAADAHSLAIGADVMFGIAAGSLATTVVLAIVSANGLGAAKDSAAQHELSVGPLGGTGRTASDARAV